MNAFIFVSIFYFLILIFRTLRESHYFSLLHWSRGQHIKNLPSLTRIRNGLWGFGGLGKPGDGRRSPNIVIGECIILMAYALSIYVMGWLEFKIEFHK